jgi:hypothetical protein
MRLVTRSEPNISQIHTQLYCLFVCLFIRRLFNDAVSSLDYVISVRRMITELYGFSNKAIEA